MQINFLILIISLLAIILIDTFGSLISRRFKINYSSFAILSFLIYFGTGYFGVRMGNKPLALALTPIPGLVESTLGWYISTKLSAYTTFDAKELDFSKKVKIAFGVTVISMLIGSLGFFLGKSNI